MTTITHTQFGTGTITSQDSNVIVVNFETTGEKKLMAQFVTLMNLDGTIYCEPVKKAAKKSGSQKNLDRNNAYRRAQAAMSNYDKMFTSLVNINGATKGDRSGVSYTVWVALVNKIEVAAKKDNNNFIVDVCQSVDKYMSCSDKQADVLAKFADQNNINN